MIVGTGTYELQGTQTQQAIIAPCFEAAAASFIRFSWGALAPPSKPIPIGWMDLNLAFASALRYVPAYEAVPEKIPGHLHLHDEDGNEGHAITRMIGERRWIAGVFWTDGRIYVDIRCEKLPDLAREVVSAELAHSVDYFLPLSLAQKSALMTLWHPGGADTHTWWEKQDYGAEYYTLGGEAFMGAFTLAYTDMVPDQSSFTHSVTQAQAGSVRTIVGVPEVGVETSLVVRIDKRPRYHRPSCPYVRKAQSLGRQTTELELSAALALGLTPCKICKP